MKKKILLLSCMLMAALSAGIAQTSIERFEWAKPDTNFQVSIEGDKSRLTLTQNTADKKEGTSSMEMNALIGAYHGWGSYAQIISKPAPDVLLNWSSSDSISIWIKVKTGPKTPANMVFRIHIVDQPTPTDPVEEYIYENATILDAVHDWVNLKVPLFERTQPGGDVPDSTGFILAPTSWGGFTYNNKKLDRDKILRFNIGLITTGWDPNANLPADSLVILLDNFARFGSRAVPLVVFSGFEFSNAVKAAPWAWGQSAVSVEKGMGHTPKFNAVKWVQGNEWGNGWTGWGADLFEQNMAGAWAKDSLKLQYKADTGTGPIRAQFESGATGKVGKVFSPIADNKWHTISLALRDMVPQDATTAFDSSKVISFGIMAEASGKAGKVLYFSNIWTGNPVIDTSSVDSIPPVPPTNVLGTAGSFVNLLTWLDVPNEPTATYNVFLSDQKFTKITDAGVEDLPPYKVGIGAQMATHVLRAPVTDQNITLYYGVNATDKAGNVSGATVSSPVTNKAKGVATIAKNAPPSFKADGALTEWATIPPILLNHQKGFGHLAPNGVARDSSDIAVKAYLAVDANNLYVAFDVVDDTVSVDTAGTDYQQDSPDLFIGLYDWRGPRHAGYARGAKPDYHFRFSSHRLYVDNGGRVLLRPGANYIWKKKALTPGYTVEAMIPFSVLKAVYPEDTLFTPKEGMRIPIDFSINDRDGKTDRDCILCYSPDNDDNSWEFVYRWSYTWIGSQWKTGVSNTNGVVLSYDLSQNYPNPFNPSTKINYQLAVGGRTSLRIYDVLGREVSTLVNDMQEAGAHAIEFNASKLSSGMYIYRLESGSYTNVKKMMLLK